MKLRLLLCHVLSFALCVPVVFAAERPNILWITCEDSSPHLSCYGDPLAAEYVGRMVDYLPGFIQP